MFPRPKNPNTPQLWDKLLFNSNKNFLESSFYRSKIDEVVTYIGKGTGRFLDVGFGSGNLEKRLINNGLKLEIYGVDISPKAIKKAKKDIKGNFHIASIFKLPYGKYFFSIIVILDVLEHIEEHRAIEALKEISRVLKKNGKLIISVPLNENLKRLIKNGKNYNEHMREYTYEILAKELKTVGIRIIDKQYLFAFDKQYKLKTFIMKFLPGFRKPNLLIIQSVKK